jgi:predicted RNase H-like nuclease (RuvC/YqgF family)
MSSVIGAIKIDEAKRAEVDANEALRPTDEQDKERAIVYGARVHQLEAELAKARASNAALTRLVGTQAAELAALKEELDERKGGG